MVGCLVLVFHAFSLFYANNVHQTSFSELNLTLYRNDKFQNRRLLKVAD